MVGERIMWAVVLWAAGFASAVIVGAKNGAEVAQGTADTLDTCDELALAAEEFSNADEAFNVAKHRFDSLVAGVRASIADHVAK